MPSAGQHLLETSSGNIQYRFLIIQTHRKFFNAILGTYEENSCRR